MNRGQRVRGLIEKNIGTVISEVFEQPPDGYQLTVGVLFDDGSSGCVRIAALEPLNESVDPASLDMVCQDVAMLSELAEKYRCSSSTSVHAWLLSHEKEAD